MLLNADRQSVLSIWLHYPVPNNHPLLMFFSAILIRTGVWNEQVFRIPSLIATCVFLLGLLPLTRSLPRLGRVATIIMLISTPLIADYLPLVRGYSMGLAATLWMALLGVQLGFGHGISRFTVMGFALTAIIAVATVPSFIFAVSAIWLTTMLVLWREHADRKRWLQFGVGMALGLLGIVLTYALMMREFLATTMAAFSSTNRPLGNVLEFADHIHALPVVVGGIVLMIAAVSAVVLIRNYFLHHTGDTTMYFMGILFVLLLPFLPTGFSRVHILTAALAIVLCVQFFSEFMHRAVIWVVMSILAVISILLVPLYSLATGPELYCIENALRLMQQATTKPCLVTEESGAMSVPYRFYLKKDMATRYPVGQCPFVVVRNSQALPLDESQKIFTQELRPYGCSVTTVDAFLNMFETEPLAPESMVMIEENEHGSSHLVFNKKSSQ